MGDVTTEQKLRLVQQIRSRYHENRYDMYNREQILYGKDARRAWEESRGITDIEPEASGKVSTFRVRLLLAVLLLTAVVAMDINGIKVAGISSEKIREVIATDYEEKIDEWVAALSQ